MCGLAGEKHKQEWNNFRQLVKEEVCAAHFRSKPWKRQKRSKISLVLKVIEELQPALAVFQNHWVSHRLARNYHNSSLSYRRTKDTKGTYHYCKASERKTERRERRRQRKAAQRQRRHRHHSASHSGAASRDASGESMGDVEGGDNEPVAMDDAPVLD